MHTVECPEEILPSKDAFHWHGQPTKQMAFHLDEREKEGGKKRKEKKREKEKLISKLDSPENEKKRMEVDMLNNTERKDANYTRSNKP